VYEILHFVGEKISQFFYGSGLVSDGEWTNYMQSNFFPAKIPFSKIQKKILAGKKFTLQMNEVQLKIELKKLVNIESIPKRLHEKPLNKNPSNSPHH
jgi:hypothetical protein